MTQLENMPSRIDKNLSLRERALRALRAFTLRNEIKIQTRELMIDQKLASTFPQPLTLRDVTRRLYKRNITGDKMWENILESSQRTNLSVDSELGVTNNFARRRNI